MLEGRAVGNLTDSQHTIYHLFVRLGYWGCSEWNTNGNDLNNLAVDTTQPKSVTFRRHDRLVSVLFGDLLSHSYNITFSMFLYLVVVSLR